MTCQKCTDTAAENGTTFEHADDLGPHDLLMFRLPSGELAVELRQYMTSGAPFDGLITEWSSGITPVTPGEFAGDAALAQVIADGFGLPVEAVIAPSLAEAVRIVNETDTPS